MESAGIKGGEVAAVSLSERTGKIESDTETGAKAFSKAEDAVNAADRTSSVKNGTNGSTAPSSTNSIASTSNTEGEKSSHLTIHIVGNKYNLRNFWSGRWRSTYVVDPQTCNFIKASIRVQAHYFENGNVQLKAENEDLPAVDVQGNSVDSITKAIVDAIEKHEQKYQSTLFSTTDMLREQAFKALRRTLPITRQKIDWDKAVSYKLGAELANK